MKKPIFSYLYFFFISLLITQLNSCDKISKTHVSNIDSDTIALKKKLDLVNQKLDNNQFSEARKENQAMKIFAQKSQNHYYLGKSYGLEGYLNLVSARSDSAYYYFHLAKNQFLEIKDSQNLAKCLGNMAIIQSNLGDYSGSEKTAVEALKFTSSKKDQATIMSLYNCLAISSSSLKNHKESEYWHRKSLQIAKDTTDKLMIQNNLAVTLMHQKKYRESIKIFNSIMENPATIKDSNLFAKTIDNCAFTKWLQNKNTLVVNDLETALNIRVRQKDYWGEMASQSHLSDYYSEHSKEKALLHAQKMYELATAQNSPDDRIEAILKIIPLETPKQAQHYAVLYTQLNDSIISNRNLAKDQFAKYRYDSEKNRKENKILKVETERQKLEIERRKLYSVLFVLIFLILIATVIIYQKNQKTKNEKIVNAKILDNEKEIARKVHDDLANNIYQLISETENSKDFLQLENKENFLNKLDNIYKLARNISRELSPLDTGKHYDHEILTLISSYKNENVNILLSGFYEIEWANISHEVKTQFYKVLQELLTNMKKYSQASIVVLTFKLEKNKFEFFYTDNGIGLTENKIKSKNGIQITENRIFKLNGDISFANNPMKGLKVNITIPI